MPRIIKKGSTNVTDYVYIGDSGDFTPETGVTIADLDLQYVRNGAAPSAKVDAVALAATDTAHTDNRMIQVDATDQPGLYRVDWPDAMFATGVDQVVGSVKGTGFHPAHKEYQLVDYDPEDAVRLGLTALANAAAGAAGGLPTDSTGKTSFNDVSTANLDTACNTVTVTSMAANVITATAINADAITSDKIADDAIGDEHWNVTRVTANSDQIEGGDATDAINAACDTALSDIKLDHLIHAAAAEDEVADNSVIARLAATEGDWSEYDDTTDSLEAIRVRGDDEWTTGAGGSAPTVGEIRTEMEVNGGKLDHLWEMTEDDSGTRRYTTNSLEQAPSGTGGDATEAKQDSIIEAVITNAAGTDIAADIIAVKAETVNILADTDDIGVAGAGLTAINLPNQTMDITGSITGNLIGDVTGNVDGTVAGVTPAAAGTAATPAEVATALTNYGANTTTPPTVAEIQAEMEENGASLLDTIRDELANGTDGLSALKTLIDAISTKTTNLPADPASETNVNANATKIDAVKAETALIVEDTNELQGAQGDWATATGFGTAVELAKVPKSDSNVTLNSTALADIATGVWDKASARTDDFGTLLEELTDFHLNDLTIVDATGVGTLRNKANSADLATWQITDDDTTTTRTDVVWS